MDLTAEQAAQLLKVTRRSIYRYVESGKLKARRHGFRAYVINLDDLREFATQNKLFFDDSLAQQLG